jgi:alpha-glucosidase
MHYPLDPHTLAIQTQFFYGPSLLISPVTVEKSTSVSFYLPNDIWFDFATHRPVSGAGTNITYTDISISDIPILIRGGSVIPLRVKSAMTTKEVREQDFEIWVAPGVDGRAEGRLYLDDGVNLVQEGVSEILFSWDGEEGVIKAEGSFGYQTELRVRSITMLGEEAKTYQADAGLDGPWEYKVGELDMV